MRRTNHIPLSFTSALYNWYAANYSTGGASIANAGWHVPSRTEWAALITAIGGANIGNAMKVKGRLFWNLNPTPGNNSSGFSAIGSGSRSENGSFYGLKASAYYQLSTYDIYSSNGVALMSASGSPSGYSCYPEDTFRRLGFSVRLLKDDATDPGSYTDIDGNVYATVKISNQVWLKSDLKVTHFNDGTPIPLVADPATWASLTSAGFCYYNNTQIVH